jgi:hypothetical protein
MDDRFWKSICRARAKDTADLTRPSISAPAEVFGPPRQLGDVDVATQKLVLAHLAAVNLEDLVPPRFVREADLDVHLQSPGA